MRGDSTARATAKHPMCGGRLPRIVTAAPFLVTCYPARVRWDLALVVLWAGCFNPNPPEGVACSPSLLCPSPLVCDRGTCNRHLTDAAIDAPPTCTPPPATAFAAPTSTSLSSTSFEATPAMPADQLEVFFKSNRDGMGNDIYRATHIPGGPFGAPARVDELSTASNDESPTLSDDGLTIWFGSDRGGDMDIYTATRPDRSSPWTAPVVVPELSSPQFDDGITVSSSQLVAYLHSNRAGTMKIFRATRPTVAAPWSTPVSVDELGSDPENPWASADDCTIYFDQSGPDGGDDLFFAVRPAPGEPFGARQPLAPLDSSADEDDPWLSPDQHYIIYASDRSGLGAYDIYESTR